MLYRFLKAYVRIFIRLCYYGIEVDKPHLLRNNKALLVASNHPNSFLDAVIFDIIFDIPLTSLARGDAFKNPKAYKVLRSLKMLPIYRQREGAENLNSNYDTFDDCIQIFKENEGVLIFSEGLCVNEWHLRPLMKGTARLAFKAWNGGVPVKVLPAGINYSSFTQYGKKIKVHLGDYITADAFDAQKTDGFNNTQFNNKLKAQLEQMVYGIPSNDQQKLEAAFGKTPVLQKIILGPFALLGIVFHYPIYLLSQYVNRKKFADTVHYDSILLAIPLLTYPLYLLLLTIIAFGVTSSAWSLLVLLGLPFSAWSFAKYDIRKG